MTTQINETKAKEISSNVSSKSKQKQATSKKLTLAEISKLAKKAQKYRKISLFDGQYQLTVHENFLDNDIYNFILDIQEAGLILKSEDVSMKVVSNYFVIYQMLLLKHFSDSGMKHIKMSDKKGVSKLLQVADELTKIGVFQQIPEFFDKEELAKIDNAIKNTDTAGKQLGELMVSATINEQEKLKELGLELTEGGYVN